MKAYVYTDKGLGRYAGRFVWLSINTEAAANAAFLKKYPIPVLPTLLVLDPKRDAVALRYAGGANVSQLSKMLDEAEGTYLQRARSAADKSLVAGDAAASEGKHGAAAKAYADAITAAPRKWSSLGRAAEALVFAYSMDGARLACAEKAVELYPRVKGTVSAANVAAVGVSCAVGLEKSDTKRDTLLEKLEQATQEVFDNPKIVLSDDDRSGLYMALIEAKDEAEDPEGALALKAEWSAFLEAAAARAKTPEQRAVYDSHRVGAYIETGMPEKAIPMLEQSERDLPDDYNPPARLALIYKELKDFDKALAASDRALAKVYGPRKLAVLSVRADIFMAKGDPKAARETLVQAIELAKSLPEGQRSDRRIAAFEKRLAGMQ